MDSHKQSEQSGEPDHIWPRKLNKVLLGIGVVAFGLIITDRVIDMFQMDDLPESAQVQQSLPVSDETTPVVQQQVLVEETAETKAIETPESPLKIEDVFGSRLVFVSASEPMYVVTENERRIDVGSSIDSQTVLAGVTPQRVILEREGNLVSIGLPEPSAN